MPSPNIWIAASDNDIAAVGRFLAADPSAVNSHDENGYTPLHAATSYNHLSLLRSLVQTHGGNVNLRDNDGDTPLFAAETVDAARCLVEEFHADVNIRNELGLTAAEAIEADGGFPLVAAYLRSVSGSTASPAAAAPDGVGVNGANGAAGEGQDLAAEGERATLPPPPEGVQVRMTEMAVETRGQGDESAAGEVVDQELRRRIEELAARGDFGSEDAQRDLRELVAGAVRAHVVEPEIERSVRRREG